MRRFILAAFLFLGVFSLAAEDLAGYVGRYTGSYSNGIDYLDMTTELSLDSGGHLVGSYDYDDGGEDAQGRLILAEVLAPGLLLFSWEDGHGSGSLKVLFAEDRSSFVGYWGIAGTSLSLVWVGERDSGGDEGDGEYQDPAGDATSNDN